MQDGVSGRTRTRTRLRHERNMIRRQVARVRRSHRIRVIHDTTMGRFDLNRPIVVRVVPA